MERWNKDAIESPVLVPITVVRGEDWALNVALDTQKKMLYPACTKKQLHLFWLAWQSLAEMICFTGSAVPPVLVVGFFLFFFLMACNRLGQFVQLSGVQKTLNTSIPTGPQTNTSVEAGTKNVLQKIPQRHGKVQIGTSGSVVGHGGRCCIQMVAKSSFPSGPWFSVKWGLWNFIIVVEIMTHYPLSAILNLLLKSYRY